MKKKRWVGIICLLLFGSLIGLAIYEQSAYILYAASLLPIVIVPLLPDIRTNRTLKPTNTNNYRIYTTAAGEGTVPDFVILEFKPGTIQWQKHLLYIEIDQLPAAPEGKALDDGVTIPVLGYDLVRHPRKRKLLGIRLKHLVQRNAGFSFTMKEVSRLVIPYSEVQPYLHTSSKSNVMTTGKGFQA